jgi:microsomal epoxide hydrolase
MQTMCRKQTFFLALLLLGCLPATEYSQTKSFATITEGETLVHSVRIHYLESGNPRLRNALILIPGWRLPAYLWSEQLRNFSDTTRVIAIDPRSQGASTKSTEGNTPEMRARDLHDLLGNLGVTHAVLVGWSQGAQDVAAYIQQFGTDSLAGAIFVDSPVSLGPAEIERHKEFSKIMLANLSTYLKDPVAFSRGMVQSLFKQPHPDLDMEKIVQFTLETPPDIGACMLVMDIFGADRQSSLAKFTKPALVIVSAESPLLNYEKEMATGIPGAQFLPIAGAGHAVFVDQPEKFDAALRKFLRALPGWAPSQATTQ